MKKLETENIDSLIDAFQKSDQTANIWMESDWFVSKSMRQYEYSGETDIYEFINNNNVN